MTKEVNLTNCVDRDTHHLMNDALAYNGPEHGHIREFDHHFENFATWLTYYGMTDCKDGRGDYCLAIARRMKVIEEGQPIPKRSEAEAFEEFKRTVRAEADGTIARLKGLNRVAMEMMFRRDVNWDEVAREIWDVVEANHRWEGRGLRDMTTVPVRIKQGTIDVTAEAVAVSLPNARLPKQRPSVTGKLNGKSCVFYPTTVRSKNPKPSYNLQFRVDGEDGYKVRVDFDPADGVAVTMGERGNLA